MTELPRLDLKSKDIVEYKQAKLKELFPEIFTEGDKIDFDKLRLTLGDSVDANDERFGLHWAGKKECFSIIQEPSIGTLKPAKEESVNWDDTENLFIEGDNLEVLKLLQKSYYGKVKMIYIDPPYNTGKEFIYPDKYQENLDTYLAFTGQIDNEGYKFSTNTETEGRYHSNWLNMMYPRLFLARNLLKEDGVIFISIDDHEVDNLIKLCAEIFGEENFAGVFPWKKRTAKSDVPFGISQDYEWIVCFCKPEFNGGLSHKRKYYETPDYPDDKWRLSDLTTQRSAKERPNSDFSMIDPKTGKSYPCNPKRVWGVTKDTFQSYYDKGKIVFPDDYDFLNISTPSFRVFESEDKAKALKKYGSEEQMKAISTFLPKEVGRSENGNKESVELFGAKVFSFPKPSSLIKHLATTINDEDAIIIDFFAGSCSSAQAVLDLNKEDAGNRKFIMVQLPEKLDPSKKEQKIGYDYCVENNIKPNIAEIAKERIKKVFSKISNEKQTTKIELQAQETALAELEAQKAKTPKLFENGKSKDLTDLETSIEELKTKIANIESTDLGFKLFKLDKSNFKVWDGEVENDVPKQIEMAINHLEPDSKEFDILFEILLKAGFELTLPIKELTLADKKVYSVEDDALLICLENELNEDVIRAIAAKEPARFVCLDTGFKDNDQLKTNAVQIMKSHNVHDFKTV